MQKNGQEQRAVVSTRNLTLAALPKFLLEDLAHAFMRVDLPVGTSLIKPERAITWVYFLDRGMASVSNLDANGTPLEVGIIGREGVVGVQALLGQRQTRSSVLMQGSGDGLRIRADVLREHILAHLPALQAMHTFIFSFMEQSSQLILCNRLHSLENRLARWLLTAADTMEGPNLQLTQEFLAEMLGVGRPAVTIAAGILQRGGLILYSRGHVEVLNRDGLKALACECYSLIRSTNAACYPALV